MRILAPFALLFAVVALAPAQGENPQVRQEIQKFYAKFDKACMAGDVKTLNSMIHPSFVQTHADGKTSNAAQIKKELAGMVKMSKDAKCKINVDQIQSQGDEAVAWVTMNMSFKMKQGNKWMPMSFTSKFAETLKKFGGEWKFIASQELP